MQDAIGQPAPFPWAGAPRQMYARQSPLHMRAVRWVVMPVLAALVIYFVGRQLRESIRAIDWWHLRPNFRWMVGAVACLVASRLPFAIACRALLASLGTLVDLTWLTGALWVSALGRYVPGKMAAGVGATVLMSRRGVAVPIAIAALLVQNALMLVISVLVSLPLAFSPRLAQRFPGVGYVCVGVIAVGIVALHPRIFTALCSFVFRRKPLPGRLGRGQYVFAVGMLVLRAALIGAAGWMAARSLAPVGVRDYPIILSATLFGQIAGFLVFFVPAGIGVQEGALLFALQPLLGAVAGIHALLFRLLQVVADAIVAAIGLLLLHPRVSGTGIEIASIDAGMPSTGEPAAIHVVSPILRDAPHKPNFFVVGAAKSGTTSLHDYLAQHPQVFMPSHKEPLYFARDFDVPAEWCVRDDRQYAHLFARAAPEVKRIGEASVWYLFSQTAAREIKLFAPAAKIIIMLRDPIDMMYSLHGQFLWNCNDDVLDFAEALAAQPERKQGWRIPPEAHIREALQYTEVTTYSPQVRRYCETFGRENVHVILFEDFARDTAGEYKKVLEFLGVDPSFKATLEIVNAAKPITPGFNRFFARRPRLRQFVRTIMPLSLVRKVNKALPFFVRTVRRPNQVDPALRRELVSRFLPEIEALERLIGRDLSAWKK